MAVETAVGQAGAFHDVRNPDAVEAALAEQLAGNLDDPFAVPSRLLPADLHRPTSLTPLTVYMTIIMYMQLS